MTVKLHFETIALGMKAKLDTRYRGNGNNIINFRTLHRDESGAASLGDFIGKNRLAPTKKVK